MSTLDSSGLTIRTQAEILAELEAQQLAEISTALDLSTSSPLGQHNRIVARAIRKLEEGLEAVYGAMDPDTATGDALRRLAALTGTYPEPATKTRVVTELNLNIGTYPVGSLIVRPVGRPLDLLRNVEQIVVAVAGDIPGIIVDADDPGPLHVAVDTLEIASPLAGFNSVTANDLGTAGTPAESDSELRLRRSKEIQSPGSSSGAGISADISKNVANVISVATIENATDGVVDTIPPHAIEVIVWGPAAPTNADNDAVALQILKSKAAGIGTHGNTTRTVIDSQSVPHSIKFTRPTAVPFTLSMTVLVDATKFPGNSFLQTHLLTGAAETLTPGLDASWSQALAWAHEVSGVLRCTTVNLGAGAFVDIAINPRQIATLALGSITVTTITSSP